jgi:hypothetical protein
MAKKKAKKNKNKPIDLDLVGQDLARMLDLKHRLIAAGVRCRETDFALTAIESIRTYIRIVRQDLEVQLRDGKLDSMTPENARQAIYACTIFEDSLRVDCPESSH